LFSIFALILVGLFKVLTGMPAPHPMAAVQPIEGLGLFLILRAFASGCVALTGVEAISNGVPAFKPPESPNARTTLTWMVGILAATFAGTTILAHALNLTPTDQETVVSQIAAAVFGRNGMYYLIQFATMLILVLAANTSFADFPRLSSILARDGSCRTSLPIAATAWPSRTASWCWPPCQSCCWRPSAARPTL
jgi:amino acid transporter